ncbi:MAG: (d)CMP kinase [Dissulfurimicrobium sp.]|uniref:(d)CMP kinase n=1 Tax=Dissulfurimicrobium sp. TaxID=2022436 RepID=UPI004049D18A
MAIITIDGPAGAGKSTISRALASRLAYTYLDTGAMYRAVALIVKENGLDITDENAVSWLLGHIHLDFKFHGDKIIMNNRDISDIIRGQEMDALSSAVSRFEKVRDYLTRLQREIGSCGDIVAEGRDMGTVVFPSADFKFFITADAPTRAIRRKKQLEMMGRVADYDEILAQIETRDMADSTRTLSPLKKASDAVVIDTTGLTIKSTLEHILFLIENAKNYKK